MIQIIKGAPTKAVTALMGKLLLKMADCATRSQAINNMEPQSMTAGSKMV